MLSVWIPFPESERGLITSLRPAAVLAFGQKLQPTGANQPEKDDQSFICSSNEGETLGICVKKNRSLLPSCRGGRLSEDTHVIGVLAAGQAGIAARG